MDNENVDIVPKEEEEYEVEKIMAHKIVRIKSAKAFKYFIKWLNYSETDNTWEKEENVYAIDMIVQYWSNIPKTNKDRMFFESLQAKKKNPILIPSPVKVAKVITASPSPPSSPVLQPSSEKSSITSFFPKKNEEHASIASSSAPPIKPLYKPQSTIDAFTTPTKEAKVSGKGKEKDATTTSVPAAAKADFEQSSVVNLFSVSSSENGGNADVAVEMIKAAEEYKTATPSSSEDEDEEESINTKKRTRSTYTDYFTEQYKKKKRVGKGLERQSSDDNVSMASPSPSEDDKVIIDETFAADPVRDWGELAVKIEYIGKEVDNGPIYCAVKWKDNAVSLHSLDLVRTKRPDLVIDAFIKTIYNE